MTRYSFPSHNDQGGDSLVQEQYGGAVCREEPMLRHFTERQCQLLLSSTRRIMIGVVFSSVVVAAWPSSSPGRAANNDSSLFRKNPLTNSFLEQVRIWEQAEADERKYGGEFQRGDAEKRASNSSYPKLLVPLLILSRELKQVRDLIIRTANHNDENDDDDDDDDDLVKALEILQQGKYDTIALKRVFNAYGDNIYYSDPDRANLYLGGGATPQSSQSLAYLYRNEIVTQIQDMRAELEYLLRVLVKDKEKKNGAAAAATAGGSSRKWSPPPQRDDLMGMAETANKAMALYLETVVPPKELQAAQALLLKEPKGGSL